MHRVTRRRLIGLLAALCLVEIGLAVGVWRMPPAPSPSVGVGVPATVTAEMPRPAGPETAPLESFGAFVERPLFLASRRPPPVAPAPSSAVPDASAKGVLFGPYRFTGIVVTPRVRIAFVTESKTGKSIVLAEGEKLGEWRCAEIQPGRVTLEKGGRRELIELHGAR